MSVTEDRNKARVENDEIEIRLSDIVQFLKASRRRMLFGAFAGLCIGILYTLSKPNIYTAQVTVMPEIRSKTGGLGGLESLAGLTGINFDNVNSPDAIRPDLYPDVLQSIPFALQILKQPVYSEKFREKMMFYDFLNRAGKKNNFIGQILTDNSDSKNAKEQADPTNFSKAIQLTKEQEDLIKSIRTDISATYDKKTGIITIVVNEPDPVVAATVARLSLEYLTDYVTAYRTEKARRQVNFLTQQVSEAKRRYQTAEYALSDYRDRNRSLFLNTAKLEEQRLQADYILQQSVYSELSKQLEQAKIKVQEETPVFKVLEPPAVPLRKSAPKRTLITFGFTVAGLIIGFIISLVKVITVRYHLLKRI